MDQLSILQMLMKPLNLLYFHLLLTTILLSCRKVVQDEFPDIQESPVVNSIIIADSLIKVHVSYTGKIDSNKLQNVDNVTINLLENNQFKESLRYVKNGLYISNLYAKPGNTYVCEVNIPGYNSIFCIDSIPYTAEIKNISHINQAGKDEEGLSYAAVKFTFTNNPGIKQYYEVIIKTYNNDYEDNAELVNITEPLILHEGLPIALFTNELIKSEIYEMTLNYTTNSFSYMDMNLYPLVLELRNISYDYYQFIKSLYLYEIGRFPDALGSSSSVFSVYSNVKGGNGIFSGYSSCQSDTIYPE